MTSPRDGARAALIVGLLIGSLGTTALLAWQADYAVDAHRRAAESVLRDYATLAANEFVRRASAKLGYDGYYPLATALSRRLEAQARLDEAVRALDEHADDRLRPALALPRRYFAYRTGSGELTFFGGERETTELREWLENRLASPPDETQPYFVRHGIVAGEPVSFVFREVAVGSGADAWIAGFEVELDALHGYLSSAFEQDPLLPPSLGRGNVSNEALFLSFLDHGGVERFRSAGASDPAFAAEAVFGEAYGGVLDGSSVRLSLDRAAASELVIGGLPPSRLPVLLGLLLLSVALMATAIREVRRERALHKLRSEFVASVSHELRTPLTQSRMFAETLLLGRVRSEEEARRSIQIIHREVRRLAHLVENVLQFSRLEEGRLRLAPQTGPLEPRVRETLELFHPLVAGSRVRAVVRAEPRVSAAFDPDAFGQVLLNLLDNAVKYGPREQEIVVGIESRNGRARVFVEDQGPGIPLHERERVFERFYRLERDRVSSVAGTGIGLSVVRELVTRQGGRVFVENGEHGGARFIVALESSRPGESTA